MPHISKQSRLGRRRLLSTALVVCGTGALNRVVGPALAEPSGAYVPPMVGTKFYRSDGNGILEITKVDSLAGSAIISGHKNQNANGSIEFFTPFMGGSQLGVLRFDRAKVASIFPLQVGKEISFESERGGGYWQNTIKVLATETVVVPTGTFETFVVERQERGSSTQSSGSAYRGTTKMWYAPTVGWLVKLEHSQTGGSWQGYSVNWVLERIEKPN